MADRDTLATQLDNLGRRLWDARVTSVEDSDIIRDAVNALAVRAALASTAGERETLNRDSPAPLIARPAEPVGEAPDWLHEIAERIRTQGNRATAHPIFVVQEKVRDYGYDTDYTDDTVWLDDYQNHHEATEEEARQLDDGTLDPDDGWTKVGYHDRWEFVQPFFTEAAADRYIETNGHRHTGVLRVYADSAYRNTEWIRLREWLKALTPEAPHG